MESNIVTINYSPQKWAQAQENAQSELRAFGGDSPTRFVTLNYKKDTSSPLPLSWSTTIPMRGKKDPRGDEPFEETPIKVSLQRLRQYPSAMSEPEADGQAIDRQWYGDVVNIGQRLRLLRDTYKVLQAVRKKRSLGERVDFRAMNDFKISSTGSPLVLEDEHGNGSVHTDEENHHVAPTPTSTSHSTTSNGARRGRPRKRGTRGRKPNLERRERNPATAAAPARSRTSRRLQEAAAAEAEVGDNGGRDLDGGRDITTENSRASTPGDFQLHDPYNGTDNGTDYGNENASFSDSKSSYLNNRITSKPVGWPDTERFPELQTEMATNTQGYGAVDPQGQVHYFNGQIASPAPGGGQNGPGFVSGESQQTGSHFASIGTQADAVSTGPAESGAIGQGLGENAFIPGQSGQGRPAPTAVVPSIGNNLSQSTVSIIESLKQRGSAHER